MLPVPIRQRPVTDLDALLPVDGGDALWQGHGAPLLRLVEQPVLSLAEKCHLAGLGYFRNCRQGPPYFSNLRGAFSYLPTLG